MRASFLVLVFACACGGEGGKPEAPCPGKASSAVYFGGPTASYLGLAEERSGAIGGVTSDDGTELLCTITRVADGWALTARHCLQTLTTPFAIPVRFTDEGPAILATSFVTHATLDLALVKLQDGQATGALLPLNREALNETWVRRRVTAAGRGLTESGARGPLRHVTTQVSAISGDVLTVDGLGAGGACLGDSGGPLLARTADGTVRIIGVLSEGSRSCTGIDDYGRVDVAIGWIERTVGDLPPPGRECDGIGAEGRCFDGVAVWCEDGTLASAACARPERCGWSGLARGYRCVAAGDDPCGGADAFGICSGSAVLTCAGGVPDTEPCGGCTARCGVAPRTGAAACLAAPE